MRAETTERLNALARYTGAAAGLIVVAFMTHYAWSRLPGLGIDWRSINCTRLAASFVLLGVAYAAFLQAWIAVAHASGLTAPWLTHSIAWSLSTLGKYVPGKVWQVAGRLALYGSLLRPGRAAAAVVFETAIQIAVASTAGGLLLLAAAPPALRWLPWLAMTCGVALFTLTFAIASGRVSRWLPVRIARWIRVDDGIPFLARCALWNVLGYAAMCAGFALAADALALQALALAPVLAGAFLLGGVIGILAIVAPAGIGARDGAIAALLLGTVSAPDAVILALAARLWLTVGEILLVTAGFLLKRANNPPQKPVP